MTVKGSVVVLLAAASEYDDEVEASGIFEETASATRANESGTAASGSVICK